MNCLIYKKKEFDKVVVFPQGSMENLRELFILFFTQKALLGFIDSHFKTNIILPFHSAFLYQSEIMKLITFQFIYFKVLKEDMLLT